MTPARWCQFSEPLPYPEAVLLQKRLVEQRIADRIPDTLLCLQHPPVITLGRRGRDGYLRAPASELREASIEVVPASRGGDITAHAPGQWVLYPILKLGRGGIGAHGYLHALEQIALDVANRFGIEAFRRDGMAGAWSPSGKFAAVGFALTRWVSWHGLSLNVNLDLSIFDLIVGCGLEGEPVTSFERILGASCPAMEAVAPVIRDAAGQCLQRDFTDVGPGSLL